MDAESRTATGATVTSDRIGLAAVRDTETVPIGKEGFT